jgi:hypothetical protein
MSVVNNNLLLTADAGVAPSAYQISRSLRFNSADSAYLNRTPSVAGNRQTWTWAGWVKRTELTTAQVLFQSFVTNATEDSIGFTSSNTIDVYHFTAPSTFNYRLITVQVLRDPSAWFHLVVTLDTPQATASNRVKIYINGLQVTSFSTSTYPSQNFNGTINAAVGHQTGRNYQSVNYFNGYLADVHFIDGQALTPSSFTETNATTGQLVPKAYTGTYGTNGFRLNFSDNSAATAATLGADSSGNGNNWTPNNLSVNAGGPFPISTSTGGLPIYNTTDTYGAVKGTGTRTDANASSLVLAIPMDGANNGTTFTDESATIRGSGSAKTITRFGDTKTLTAQSKFYGSSGFFDGTGDYLSAGSSSDYLFGTSDFTVEGWFYLTSDSTRQDLIGNYTDSTSGWGIGTSINVAGQIVVYYGNTIILDSATRVWSPNTWNHFALTRSGTSLKLFVNGVNTTTTTNSTNIAATAYNTLIGAVTSISTGSAQLFCTGYIQDFRIYKGLAKYTSNFTPPSATQNTTIAAGCDSLTDTPTSYGTDTGAGGEVRGNYATLNPLDNTATLSNGNLDVTWPSASYASSYGTIAIPSTGSWYYECNVTASVILGRDLFIGISLSNGRGGLFSSFTSSVMYRYDGLKYIDTALTAYGASFILGDVIGVAINSSSGQITFYKNGTSQGAISYSLTGKTMFPCIALYTASTSVNFGQRPFAYAAPSGFKALCDTNLPTPTIAKGSSVFDTKLYTGNGSTQTISGLNFSPDWIWVKNRSASASHILVDTIRGAANVLVANVTSAEQSIPSYISSLDSSGFSIGTNSADLNQNANSYVAWAWDAGSSTVTNTAGTITSQVRANASAGFSVATYTGTGATATVGHGLGVAPSMVIVKRRDTTGNWQVRHISIAAANSIQLNLTNAAAAATTIWNSTAPSSSIFSVGTDATINASSGTYVAYCFAPVTGYSAFGSYTGNGSADGPFVYLGFRPAFLMIKRTDTTGNWVMLDNKREGYNVDNDPLCANLGSAESTDDLADITSNGFKLRSTNAEVNASGGTCVYACFAENPFQYARAR